MKILKKLFLSPFSTLSGPYKAGRILLILAAVALAALLFDLLLLGFLEPVVDRAGDILHVYEKQIAGK